jgi:hypothetical protein
MSEHINDQFALLEMLKEDRHRIAYRPAFARLVDNALAAVLLQEIFDLWVMKDRKPFYKFKAECQHRLYRDGDSWCETLEWNRTEFDNALQVIGTKIGKGDKKADLLAMEIPEPQEGETSAAFRDRFKAMLRCLVCYWTDGDRVTWYELNEALFAKVVNRLYISKVWGLRYIEKSVSSFIHQKQWTDRRYKAASFSSSSTSNSTAAGAANAHAHEGQSQEKSKDPNQDPSQEGNQKQKQEPIQEPDGTCPYMVENQRRLKPGDDWLDAYWQSRANETLQASEASRFAPPPNAAPPPSPQALPEPERPAIMGLYEQAFGRMVDNDMLRDTLLDLDKEYPADWLIDAFKESGENHAKYVKYTVAILERWRRDGKPRPKILEHPAAKQARAQKETDAERYKAGASPEEDFERFLKRDPLDGTPVGAPFDVHRQARDARAKQEAERNAKLG